MGKGFNNYMTKKFFHPASKDNIKRVWMAQQKTTFDKKKQEDLMNQYQKEQEMLSNRALLGDEKAKLGLSFIYDAPPGLRKKEQEDEGEQEIKFEWQRKYNAPREAYAKDDETIRDQPFGIEVRNVRCIKCRQWGHVNTDKICPLFGRNLTAEPPQPENTTASLLEGLKEEGFRMKKSIVGRLIGGEDDSRVFNSDEDDPEAQFLKSLTPKQKKKLLKKLDKLQAKGKMKKKKKDKKRKKEKKSRKSSSESDSESSDSEDRGRKHGKKTHKKPVDRSDSIDSDSDRPRARTMKRKNDLGRSERRGPPPGEGRSRSPLMRVYRGTAPSRRRPESTRTRRELSSDDGLQNRRYKDVRVKQEHSDSDDKRKISTIQGRKSQIDERRDRSRDSRRERSAEQKQRRRDRSSSSSEEEVASRRNDRSAERKHKRKEQSSSSSEEESASRRNNISKNIKRERSPERKHKRKDQSSSSSEDEIASRKTNISKNIRERSDDRKHKRKEQSSSSSEDEEIASNMRQERNGIDRKGKYSESKSSRYDDRKARSSKDYVRETRQESFRDERRDRRDDRGDQRDRRDDGGDRRDRRDDRGDRRDRRDDGGDRRDKR